MLAFRRLLLVLLTLVLSAGVLCGQIKKETTRDNEFVLSTPAWKMVFAG